MIIRKEFKFCAGHIVRNCAASERCSKSIHGHNFVLEVFFESDVLDHGQMVLDFGLTKTTMKDFMDAFDHSFIMWDQEPDEYKDFFKKWSKRWVELPVSPSAESLALVFCRVFERIVNLTCFSNGERFRFHGVRIHETDTGYAEATLDNDFELIHEIDVDKIKFSEGTFEENIEWWDGFVKHRSTEGFYWKNKTPNHQIK